jgi:hypothetical protein
VEIGEEGGLWEIVENRKRVKSGTGDVRKM